MHSETLPVTTVVSTVEAADDTRAVAAWVRVLSASNDLIRARFDLGELVYGALRSGAYGDGVVVRLAALLSRESGKLVTPAILYDVARLYTAFGGQYARVEALRARLTFPLTYSYLVRTCVPIVTRETSWNMGEWEGRQHVELMRLEHAVLQIEDRFAQDQHQKQEALRAASAVPVPMAESFEGFGLVCQQSSAYQDVAIHTLLGRVGEAVSHLERKAGLLQESDREVLRAYGARCGVLGLREQESGLTESAAAAAA